MIQKQRCLQVTLPEGQIKIHYLDALNSCIKNDFTATLAQAYYFRQGGYVFIGVS